MNLHPLQQAIHASYWSFSRLERRANHVYSSFVDIEPSSCVCGCSLYRVLKVLELLGDGLLWIPLGCIAFALREPPVIRPSACYPPPSLDDTRSRAAGLPLAACLQPLSSRSNLLSRTVRGWGVVAVFATSSAGGGNSTLRITVCVSTTS